MAITSLTHHLPATKRARPTTRPASKYWKTWSTSASAQGMYIGGTDERALHHMAAEVIDNSMDEAIAGHADWIEIELHDNFHLTVRDNGRGIPIDPHPKFPDKSALEIIFCTLNAGGKFTGDALSNLWRVARSRRVRRQCFVRHCGWRSPETAPFTPWIFLAESPWAHCKT